PTDGYEDAGQGGLRGPVRGQGGEGEHVHPPGREARDHQTPEGVPGGRRRTADRGVLMGKNLPQQRRGRGTSPTYRSPSHRHPGVTTHPKRTGEGVVLSLEHAPGRTAPIARVQYGRIEVLMIAPDGLRVGQVVTVGGYNIDRGNTLPLGSIPEGTLVYNVESKPGDGGKFVRAAGTTAVVVSQADRTVLQLPSGQFRTFDPKCRATSGVIAVAGRAERTFGQAGKKVLA